MTGHRSRTTSAERRPLLLMTVASLAVAILLIALSAVLGIDWSLMAHQPM
jgi:hypothetical protein